MKYYNTLCSNNLLCYYYLLAWLQLCDLREHTIYACPKSFLYGSTLLLQRFCLHFYFHSSVDLDVHACAVCASVFGRILTTYYSRRRRRRRQWNGTRFDDNDRHRCHHCCSGPVVTRQSVGRRRMVVCVSFFAVHAHHTVRAFVSIETTNYFPPLFCTLTTR